MYALGRSDGRQRGRGGRTRAISTIIPRSKTASVATIRTKGRGRVGVGSAGNHRDCQILPHRQRGGCYVVISLDDGSNGGDRRTGRLARRWFGEDGSTLFRAAGTTFCVALSGGQSWRGRGCGSRTEVVFGRRGVGGASNISLCGIGFAHGVLRSILLRAFTFSACEIQSMSVLLFLLHP